MSKDSIGGVKIETADITIRFLNHRFKFVNINSVWMGYVYHKRKLGFLTWWSLKGQHPLPVNATKLFNKSYLEQSATYLLQKLGSSTGK